MSNCCTPLSVTALLRLCPQCTQTVFGGGEIDGSGPHDTISLGATRTLTTAHDDDKPPTVTTLDDHSIDTITFIAEQHGHDTGGCQIGKLTAYQVIAHLRHTAHNLDLVRPPAHVEQQAPEHVNTYADGCLLNPQNHNLSVGAAGVWSEYDNNHTSCNAHDDALDTHMGTSNATERNNCNLDYDYSCLDQFGMTTTDDDGRTTSVGLGGHKGSSYRSELLGAITAVRLKLEYSIF